MAIVPNTTFSSGAVLTADQMNRLPWGIMGYGQATTNQTGISTTADVTSLTTTFTANSTRYYRTTVYISNLVQVTSNGYVTLFITDSSNSQKQSGTMFKVVANGNGEAPMTVVLVETGISGSTTRKARLTTSAGTVETRAAANQPAFIVVEDIGQA